MYRTIMLLFAVYLALVTVHHGLKIREPRKQRKLIWSTFVLGFWALASLLYGLGAFVHGYVYLVATQSMWAISLMLVASIPCGLVFFNQKGIRRPVRDLFLLALGVISLWSAIEWLHQVWAPW